MHPARAVLALLLVTSWAPAQEATPPGRQSQLKPGEMCTVEGMAVKATTGEPVKKVLVTIFPVDGRGQQHSASTDASGRFVIRNVEPGGYFMHAGGNGYPFQAYGQRAPGRRGKILALDPGRHERDIVFRLMPGSVITGTVYDEDGDPVVGANVQGLRFVFAGGPPQMGTVAGAQTNDLGEYRLYGLEPGQYYVVANYQNQRPPNEPSDDVYLPTFYPNTPDPAQAVTVQVRPGDDVPGINLSLTRVRGVRVRGHVLNEVTGKTFEGSIYVQVMPQDGKFAGYSFGNYGASVQDDKGTFEIRGLPPGSYALSANWNDEKKSYFGRVPVDVANTDIEGVTLVISPGTELRGRIRTNPGARLDFSKLNLWLQPSENMMAGGGGAEIKADGTFVVHNVYDGNYRLHVGGFPEEFYLKSARIGGSDVLETGLNISRTQAVGTLELELALTGGRVDGTVLQDQKPVPGVLVVLVPDPPFRNRDEMYSVKNTDQLGRFSLLGLPPGDFKLFAWEAAEGASFRDPDFLKLYESRGTPVSIQEGQQQTVQVELIPAEEEQP